MGERPCRGNNDNNNKNEIDFLKDMSGHEKKKKIVLCELVDAILT